MRPLATVLSLNRIGFGLAYLLRPGPAGHAWIGRAARKPATQVFARGLAARDLALGTGALVALGRSERAARPWLIALGVADGADFAATIAAGGRLPRSGRRLGLVVAGASTIAATVAALGLGRSQGP